MFEDEPQTITFFKDVTFGILYKQIKANEVMQGLLNKTLDKKINIHLK
jgi:hypothetical protein